METNFDIKNYINFIISIPHNAQIIKESEKGKPKKRGRKKQQKEYLVKFKNINQHIPLSTPNLTYISQQFSLETDYYPSIPIISEDDELLVK